MESKKIYHYCSLNTAIEHILPNKELLINPIGKSNDPRENENYNFVYSYKDAIEDINPWLLNEKFSSLIKKGCKHTCFASDNDKIKGYEFSRLWALYSDNHKGICLEIDEAEFLLENSHLIKNKGYSRVNGYLRDIKYEDLNDKAPLSLNFNLQEYSNKPNEYIENFRQVYIEDLFFRKNNEWASENESRLLLISSKNEMEFCSIRKSLCKIILGVDFNFNYLPSIKEKNEQISIYQVTYWNGRLNLKKI